MKITEAFLGEHGVIYALLNHLEQEIPNAESSGEVQSQAALLIPALASHAQLEDLLLFPALESKIGPAGPLTVMRFEHNDIDETLGRLLEVRELNRAQALIRHLLLVAREHFAKEEKVLFPMAEQVLGEMELQSLGKQWAEKRQVSVSVAAALPSCMP
ncbi:MAG: hemerythrin domain-containing protein [Cyanobacteria bacterium NC_groundwater_1444_Ag_S-0.65um_54_12]|nr:hemerythrin domain-containing protein [Cyanobacteria bacterium NC_groundwater_1444_Ag_S-0.65um_54_12]